MNKKRLLFILLVFVAFSVSSQNKWTNIIVSDSIPSENDINSIEFDKDGNMWVGTLQGVHERISNKWVSAGLPDMYVQTLYIDAHDVKWVGCWGTGLYKSADGLSWNSVSDISPASSINVIKSDNNGTIWAGDWTCGVFFYNNVKWVHYNKNQISLGDNTVTSIVQDAKNKIWFGTYHGMTIYDSASGASYNYNIHNSKLPDNDVYSLCTDTKNNIWIGTINGLAKYDGQYWTVYKMGNAPGMLSNLILCIACDGKGNIWVGTEKGLCRFDGKRWVGYTTKNSRLIDNRVQTIKIRNNKMYIGTPEGISVFE